LLKVIANFNSDKDPLLARYQRGTEQALEQADFLNNPDITVMQALIIYLSVLQHTSQMKSAWLLAGVLVRLAVSMKLHQDGTHFPGISTFETEFQRRIWWQICFIDSRSEELQVSQFKLSEDMFDTEIPGNVNDVNLDPGISQRIFITDRWTDMTIFLIRCEVWKLSRQLQSVSTTIEKKLELFQQSQATIEDTYLNHININKPLHNFVAASARLFLAKVDLILHSKQHSVRGQPPHILQSHDVFLSSLSIIEYTYALQSDPSWNGWTWQIQGGQPPWHALHVVLNQLRTKNWEAIYPRAWESAKRSLEGASEAARRDPHYQQLSVLASVVQKRAGKHHHQPSGSLCADDNLASTEASNLTTPPTSVDLMAPQGPFLSITDESDHNDFGDALVLEMDWQVWDEIAGDLELWDMGSI
jgi:hypothetical protein